MSKRLLKTTFGFATALLLAAGSAAQSVTLKPKYTAGKTDYLEHSEDIEQTMTGAMAPDGMTMKIKALHCVKRTVEAADKDKGRIKFTYDRLASVFDAPMAVMDYDSDRKTNDVDAATYEDIYKLMLGESIKAEIGPDGRSESVTGMKDIVAKIDKEVTGNMFWAQMKDHFTDESFGMQMINWRSGLLPSKEVKPGDTWTTTLREKQPNIGTMIYDLKCTLKSVDKKDGRTIATIEYDGKITSEPAKDEPNAMGMSVKLESGETKGVAEFDVDGGDVVRTQTESKLNMAASMSGAAPDGDGGMKIAARSKGSTRAIAEKERADQKKTNAEKTPDKSSEKPAPKTEKPVAPK